MSAQTHSKLSEKTWIPISLSLAACGLVFLVGSWVSAMQTRQTYQDAQIVEVKANQRKSDDAASDMKNDLAIIKTDLSYIKRAVSR